jgi:membrane protease YdiL (CAAX protease family)
MRPILLVYAAVAAGEWAIVVLLSRRVPWRELIGRRTHPLLDVALAAAMWGAWVGVKLLLNRTPQPPTDSPVVQALLPHGAVEIACWILLAVTAGIAEEIIFRGYLQRRFGVVAQAAIFGAAHAYQGLYAALVIALYGLFFGVVAKRYRSIVPGIFAHAWTDIAAGIFRI